MNNGGELHPSEFENPIVKFKQKAVDGFQQAQGKSESLVTQVYKGKLPTNRKRKRIAR